MGRRPILDSKLVSKLVKKYGKRDIQQIRVMVSKKAAKHGISAEAALILLAKEKGIGTATFQRKLDLAKQTEVRDALPLYFAPAPRGNGTTKVTKVRSRPNIGKRAAMKSAIEFVIQDPELRSRCADILMASSNFDRPVNQATLVLEDRIRRKAQPPKKLVGENLVGFAFNEELAKTVLQVASNDGDDQRGFTQILRGIVPPFRNKTHHHIVHGFSREEALRVCGFIDVLLRVVDNSVKLK
jgi:hypothetical protein